ncbi:MAG: PD-(D/E)XK nuclease family protein [Actinomycetota bacterium]|nr:PD-(D/E)XK nuclease family protein [Actinomycetota bacterium]
MELTTVQRRTLESLIGTAERPSFPLSLAERIRDRIEDAVRTLDLSETLWLGKSNLTDLGRCEGFFQSVLAGERTPFEHSPKTAAGKLFHKSIELEVSSREELPSRELAGRAVERLEDDAQFTTFWAGLEGLHHDELIVDAAKIVDLFRSSFPPLRPYRRELAPVPEARLRAELLGGALVLSGQIDLLIGAPSSEPGRATRLAIDLKSSGRGWPEYPEDMRFYALLMTLRFGVPPYRVATLFLESGEWQAEDVTEGLLIHAADRVISAARASAALAGGRPPALSAGRFCEWCPRGLSCPASSVSPAEVS